MVDFLIESSYELVRDFHKAFSAPLDKPLVVDAQLELRIDLIAEEANELLNELEKPVISKAAVAKELADLLYVTYSFAATYGIDIDEVFYQVHKSNLSKLGANGKPVYREDGKVMKGPDYKPPQLEFIFK